MFQAGDRVKLREWVTEHHMQEIQMHMIRDTFTVIQSQEVTEAYYGHCVRVREDHGMRLRWIIKECYLELILP
jgi:hypothetical protein